MNLHPKGLIFG